MFFSLKKDSRTRGHEVKLVKDQCRLDVRKYLFSQRTINEWNKLSTDCITGSSVNMFKNKVDTSQEGGLHVDEHCWTLNKPKASLSTCHLGLWLGWQILLKQTLQTAPWCDVIVGYTAPEKNVLKITKNICFFINCIRY